jgi:flavocytochrome c
MSNVSRRSFLKGVGAAAVVTSVSMHVPVFAQAADIAWDETYEIIVVGAGASGMSAAIAAATAGKKVVLLEKGPTFYASSSSVCGGGVLAAEAFLTKQEKIEYSKDLFYKEILEIAKNRNIPELAKLYVDNAADTIQWFYERGMKYFLRSYPGLSQPIMYSNEAATGRTYIEIMEKEIKSMKLPVKFDCPAQNLIVDPAKNNEVLGVRVSDDGRTKNIRATKAVVLTSGGYCGTKELLDRFVVPYMGSLVGASTNSLGEGFLMANKIGATSTHMGFASVYGHGVELDKNTRRGLISRTYDIPTVSGGISVNIEGKRFMPENSLPTTVALRLIDQPEATMFMIADQAMVDKWVNRPVPGVIGWSQDRLRQEISEQKIFTTSANTIEELCKKAGIGQELVNTVKTYNEYVKKGVDESFGRAKATMIAEFSTPPYYAFKNKPIAYSSTGGLRVDNNLQVLDPYLLPIPNLYAAGEIVGGLHGVEYLGGLGFGGALTFGRLVGEFAAK